MSYATIDLSTEDGQPVLLYEFTRGATVYRYASLTEQLSAFSATWDTGIVIPSEFGMSNDFTKDTVTLKLPINDALAQRFLGRAPDEAVTLVVYRFHLSDTTDRIVIWRGRVMNAEPGTADVTLFCAPKRNALDQRVPAPVCGKQCDYVLYNQDTCMLSADALSVNETATDVDAQGTMITVPGLIATTALYVGGSLQAPDGTSRTIVYASGGNFTIDRPIESLTDAIVADGSASVTLFQGCDRTIETCQEKGNLGNFGGFAWWADTDPFNDSMV